MKKKIVLLALFSHLITAPVLSATKIPVHTPLAIKEKLIELKQQAKLELDSCRTNPKLGDIRCTPLSGFFQYPPSLKEQLDSTGLILDWKMVYDEDMIKRMVQLLKNEYRKEELELLVNRQMAHYGQVRYERWALYQIGLENPKIFKHTQDNLDKHRDREQHPNLYQYDDVGKYLKWDTLPRFRFLVDSFKVAFRNEITNDFLTQIHFDIKGLLSICYYVPDKRFIKPLINIAEHLEEFGLEYNPNSIDLASEVLVKMQVEPYYSNYFKKVSHSLEEVKQMKFVNVIDFLSTTLHNQDAYRELSKYLYSSAATRASFIDDDKVGGIKEAGKAYEDAFKEIEINIENKDLQEMINAPNFNLEKDRFKVYDWMQKNYKKYKIKRIW